jgi:RNA polymerase sigma factor (sigma-70 family)
MQATERLARLIEPVHDRALAFARCLCRSRADGDDLYQEALLRALTKLDGLRDDAAFRPWLYRIVITVHRNRARRAFWRRLLPLGDMAAPDGATGGEGGVMDCLSTRSSPMTSRRWPRIAGGSVARRRTCCRRRWGRRSGKRCR